MHDFAIIGFGPAGMFMASLLPTTARILILEKECIGGDLFAKYGHVVANITKADIVGAFRKIPAWQHATFPQLDEYADTACPRLVDACHAIISTTRPSLHRFDIHIDAMIGLQKLAFGWRITTQQTIYEAKSVILCSGALPKQLDLPLLSIPLNCALSRASLEISVRPSMRIVVFGTSHSGTLVLKNLNMLGCMHVTAVHKGSTIFRFARDGDTEGLKQESATIADEIIAKDWGNLTPTFLSYNDFAAVYRAVATADAVIYAIGFSPPSIQYTDIYSIKHTLEHDPHTSGFRDVDKIWGFGMGYPSVYRAPNGNIYPDIGFLGFITAMLASLPAILA